MIDALSLPFFQRALVAGLLASVACGVVGTYVVVRRIASISGGLAHSAFGGIGLGYLAGFSPMLGAVGFGVLSALGVGLAYRRFRTGLDTLIAMVWSVGMAVGITLIALTPGYAPDLLSYLFGNILFVSSSFLGWVVLLDITVVIAAWVFYKELQAVTFDEEFAQVMGVPVEQVFMALLALTALVVVTLIRVVGVILVIALLTIPAAIARQWCDSLARMMLLATAVGALCTTGGLFVAYGLSVLLDASVPTGPLIILLSALLYGVSSLTRRLQ